MVLTNAVCGLLLAPVAVVQAGSLSRSISAVLGVSFAGHFLSTPQTRKPSDASETTSRLTCWRLSLFKDSLSVTFRSQVRVFAGAFKLLFYAIVPMLVMIVPVCLILAQMGLWYQARPLKPGDDPVMVKLKLHDNLDTLPQVILESLPAARTMIGPVRVFSKKEIYWKIKSVKEGNYNLVFHVGDRRYEKHLAVGEGFMRVSPIRPGPDFSDILLYPLERPFSFDSPVYSISIDYPERDSRISGTNWWIVYFFIASMIFAFLFKPLLKVRI